MDHAVSPWHRWAVVVAVVVAALALVVPGGQAAAQEDGGDELGLSAEVGFDGDGSARAWMPLTVTISPSAPVRGRLAVVTESGMGDGGRLVQRRDVDVAAGATEQVRVLVPPGSDRPEVTLQAGDARATVRANASSSGPVVGVLGDADFADRVGAVTDPFTEEVWTTVVVDPGALDLGPLALESMGSLVADAEALDALGDQPRRTLDAAVNHQGLHLLVTGVSADPGIGRAPGTVTAGTIDPVSTAWPMAVQAEAVARVPDAAPDAAPNAASVRSGRGRVTWLTDAVGDDALRSPRTWGQLWTATPVGLLAPWERQGPVDPWLLRQQGLRLPSSWGMSAFVATYLLVAGGVALVVVRRLRRRELAWVVLPGVALVLAATAFVASSGNDVLGGRAIVAATWIDNSGVEEVVALGHSDDAPALLPGEGWQVASLSWPGTGAEPTADGMELMGTGDDSFGESSVAWGQRVSPAAAPVVVEAARLDDGVHVEVVNTGPVALAGLRIVGDGQVAGDVEGTTLAAGETATVVLSEPAGGDWSPAGMEVDDDRFVEDVGQADGRATMSGHVQELVDETPDLVWVLALADEVVPPPRGLGRLDAQVVAVGVTPTVDLATAAPVARMEWGSGNGEFGEFDESGPRWMRLTPPGPGSVATLAVDLPTADREDCVDWIVYDGRTGADEVRTLCGDEEPECPPDADCVSENDQSVEVCDADGSCVYWERQGGGPTTYEIWDTTSGAYRTWDAAAEADVDADPGRVVTPLGDVVVRHCCGPVARGEVEVTTGGGS